MGASSFKDHAPFLTYLTVFKSRVGIVNIVLPLTDFAYQSPVALSRRLKQKLTQKITVPVNRPATAHILEYLTEKKLVGTRERKKGRYTEFSLRKES